MKVLMCTNWGGFSPEDGIIWENKPSWYIPDQSIDLTIEMQQELIDAGFKIMIFKDKDKILRLAIDTRKFGQR